MAAKTDKERRKEAKTQRKEAAAAAKAEKVKQAESKRKVREQNGGAGIKILVFERAPPTQRTATKKKKR